MGYLASRGSPAPMHVQQITSARSRSSFSLCLRRIRNLQRVGLYSYIFIELLGQTITLWLHSSSTICLRRLWNLHLVFFCSLGLKTMNGLDIRPNIKVYIAWQLHWFFINKNGRTDIKLAGYPALVLQTAISDTKFHIRPVPDTLSIHINCVAEQGKVRPRH